MKQAVESNADKNIMIIVRGPKEALRLVHELPQVREINYGGVAKKQDSKPYGKAVYLIRKNLRIHRRYCQRGSAFIYSRFPPLRLNMLIFQNSRLSREGVILC